MCIVYSYSHYYDQQNICGWTGAQFDRITECQVQRSKVAGKIFKPHYSYVLR